MGSPIDVKGRSQEWTVVRQSQCDGHDGQPIYQGVEGVVERKGDLYSNI